jgi:hypothetical protein
MKNNEAYNNAKRKARLLNEYFGVYCTTESGVMCTY